MVLLEDQVCELSAGKGGAPMATGEGAGCTDNRQISEDSEWTSAVSMATCSKPLRALSTSGVQTGEQNTDVWLGWVSWECTVPL